MATAHSTFTELLLRRLEQHADCPAFTFLNNGEKDEITWSYGELAERALSIAARLQRAHLAGQRVLLLYPPGLEYIAGFCGCLAAGVVAVPVYPPRSNRTMSRLEAVARDSEPAAVLTTEQALTRMKPLLRAAPEFAPLEYIATDVLPRDLYQSWTQPALSGDSTAFLQYTSGSTATPRGVMVSQANLLHNESSIATAFQQSSQSVIAGWLPPYHDMGLIGQMLQPLYLGARCIFMSPAAFLQRPFRWLSAISRYGATTSGGPNFAYDLCVRRISADEECALDLSKWTVAFNGAEPVRAETLERFAARFGKVGFKAAAFAPCYGLAEGTLLVSGHSGGKEPAARNVNAAGLAHNEVRETVEETSGRRIVSCGTPVPATELRVVDPESCTRCSEDRVGEIWISGPSVTPGYWNRVEENRQVFQAYIADTGEGPFLRTGDLGFLRDQEVFVTGRLKDLIIIRGRNIYPQDIEAAIDTLHPALRPGCGAAFAIAVDGEERLAIVQEVERTHLDKLDGIVNLICKATLELFEISPHAVVLLRPAAIPKTSSGKVQRSACRNQFQTGSFDSVMEWRASAFPDKQVTLPPAPVTTVTPRELERWLVNRIAAVRGLAPGDINVNESLARYGMDSLEAIECGHSMEQDLGMIAPLSALLKGDSIRSLSEELLNAAAREDAPGAPASQERPLTPGQKALWFLHYLDDENTAYNLTFAARSPNRLESERLRKCLQRLTDRHDLLRTTFHAAQGEPFQRVHNTLEAFFDVVDVEDRDEQFLQRRFADEAAFRFNLEQGPLLRATLFRRSNSEYFVCLTVHHIIADLWSLALLMREWTLLYAEEPGGEKAALSTLSSTYDDYRRWQETMLAGKEGARLYSYWSGQLAGELPVLSLPSDRPRPPVQTYRGDSIGVRLSPELTKKIKTLSQKNAATVYVTLLAAFQILLSRYSGQSEILVGSPTVARNRTEWSGVFGYFVNPIVLRGRLGGNPSFLQFLSEVRKTVVEGLKHQDYPFFSLVERLQPERDPARSPLFQAMFAFEKTMFLEREGISAFALGEAGTSIDLNGLVFEPVAMKTKAALFDLMLMVAEVKGEICCSFQYNVDLFDEETIRRMVRHWEVLLNGIVAAPQNRIKELPLLTGPEREQLVHEWNFTDRTYSGGNCVQGLFQEQVKRTPTAVAVEFGGQQIDYQELNVRANQLAHYLLERGVGPEVRVGVCLERNLELPVALLGILKAGGAYVPLDPKYPPERLSFVLEDAGVQLVLTNGAVAGRVPPSKATIVRLDTDWQQIAKESASDPKIEVERKNLAYVICTSGSTGRPKAVGITHGSAIVFIHWAREVFSAEERAAILASTSISFDLSVFEIFVPLSWGGRVIVCENVLELADLEAADRVRLINTVPSAMAQLIRMKCLPKSLLTVNLAGEALPSTLVKQLHQEGIERVFNLYGPSEDTTYSSYALLTSAREWPIVPIGKPIANTRVYVLDEEMSLNPVGVAGELYIGGDGLARGYLNRADLTGERFVPDPFGENQQGARLYRTGDLVRWSADGNLEFLARMDHQVKLRGHRIELGEIEAVLNRCPAVERSVVMLREDQPGEKQLVAYVVADAGQPEEGTEIGHWQQVWQQMYESGPERPRVSADDFDVVGWNSSYTGQPIPREEMRTWVEETVARLRALRPARVLEIGCGTGLLLTRVGAGCESYVGLDFSAEVLAQLRDCIGQREELRHVELREGAAHELGFAADDSVDLVVLNSVVQYFPNVDYLLQVLREAVRVTRRGGHIFVGDVRSLALLEAFYASVGMYRGGSGMSVEELRERIGEARRNEEELVLDAGLFEELGRRWEKVGRVERAPKTGVYDNELSRFRYDVTIGLGPKATVEEPERWLGWEETGFWREQVKEALAQRPEQAVGVRGIRDGRVARAVNLVGVLERAEEGGSKIAELEAASGEARGEDPAAVMELARSLGVECHWRGFSREGMYDVVFHPRWMVAENTVEGTPQHHYRRYTNQPARSDREAKLVRALREQLRQAVPDYMAPSAIVVLPAWPLTPNGKVDRKRLPKPTFGRAPAEPSTTQTPLEEILLGVWSEVLKLDRIDIHESFFDLGGHSLLAAQVVSRMRALGMEIPLSMLFAAPTVHRLASRLRDRQRETLGLTVPPVTARPHNGPQPLSFGQQRLWFFDQMHPDSPFYNITGAVRLRGELDVSALESALGELVQRHESLRTRLETVNNVPMQTVEQDVEVRLPIEDLSSWETETERELEARSRLRWAASELYDLRRAPLFRTLLIRFAACDYVLMLGMHHIVSDGWSMGVLIRELTTLYAAFRKGDPSPLPPLPVQYADFARWQRAWLEGEVLEKQLAYWRQHLAGMPGPLLPTALPRSEDASFHTGTETFSLPAEPARLLKALCREQGVTFFMILLAAFKVLLHYYAKQDDIVVGTNIANRGQIEVEGLIGFFVNQLVLRTDLSGNPSFIEVLTRVRETTLAAHAHQDVPFDKLVADLQPERVMNRSPLFQVKFECAPDLWRLPVFVGLQSSAYDLKLNVLRHDLHLVIDTIEPVVSGTMIYDCDIFLAGWVRTMLDQYQNILAAVSIRPEIQLRDIVTLLDEKNRQSQLSEVNRIRNMERTKLGAATRKSVTIAIPKGA